MSEEYCVEKYERNGLIVKIIEDTDPMNPRVDWDNAGTMICSHRNYTLGDEQFNSDDYDGWDDLKKYLIEWREAVIILPLDLYDHSGITMYIPGDGGYRQHEAWDSGQVGFIYITQADIDKDWTGDDRNEQAEKCLRAEVKTYDQYLTGQVYGFDITNPKNGECVDSCWGFFGQDYCVTEANDVADNFVHPHDAAYAKNAVIIHG